MADETQTKMTIEQFDELLVAITTAVYPDMSELNDDTEKDTRNAKINNAVEILTNLNATSSGGRRRRGSKRSGSRRRRGSKSRKQKGGSELVKPH
jgi:hypothetical protein